MSTVSRRDPDVFPPYYYEAYRATIKRSPRQPLVPLPPTLSELTGPGPELSVVHVDDADLTRNMGTGQEAIGERIIVTGRVLDERGAPMPGTLVEIWQANAAGRYRHRADQHHAPLDPNFLGWGRFLTDADGVYRFVSIRPGAYPWLNHPNAWRPPHIHFSLFGPTWTSRLITQMFFPGDPLLALDPIFNAVPAGARDRLIARYAHDVTQPEYALGYRFDIVLRGPMVTPFEPFEAIARPS
ncbi:MAG: protocatechuate 3,4-dioxygenase subunit beta [Armatimonadota bacterium]|nr:protocatechuate 3,4-dioxygenase subunit beta [Armatimonadota bacterium]MDR7534425.1 protocatechuate 3,4-dioxygenase subunit beta [Armatimonadota bacterium]MDR7535726.1 protocatechuate 3,4-dioxygenase subunit beta [Armatimonadota bacterium]